VAEAQQESRGTRIAVLKVIYLLAVTVIVFAIPSFVIARPAQWYVVTALMLVQAFTLMANRVSAIEAMRPAWRLKWLFLFLIVAYALLPPETAPSDPPAIVRFRIPAIGWIASINLTGVAQAGLMCLQTLTVLLASSVVRLTGKSDDLVRGLEAFRLPRLFVYSLDHTLNLLGGVRAAPRAKGRGRGGGGGGAGGGGGGGARTSGGGPTERGDPAVPVGFFNVLRRVIRGDFGAFTDSIRQNLELAVAKTRSADEKRGAEANFAHDVAIVTGVALCMSSIKMLKLLPGLPFASGHRTLILFPLYVLASRLTHSRWGATAAGSIMGLFGFLQGDGRFGILEVPKHVAPGVVIDLMEPVVRRWPGWALGYCFLGLLAGIARTATEFLVIFALGARAEIYLFPAARLLPNLLAGFLSGFVTVFVLRALVLTEPSRTRSAPDEGRPDDTVELPTNADHPRLPTDYKP
jgi:hypothetical protein